MKDLMRRAQDALRGVPSWIGGFALLNGTQTLAAAFSPSGWAWTMVGLLWWLWVESFCSTMKAAAEVDAKRWERQEKAIIARQARRALDV